MRKATLLLLLALLPLWANAQVTSFPKEKEDRTEVLKQKFLAEKAARENGKKQSYQRANETINVLDSAVYSFVEDGIYRVETYQYDSRGNRTLEQSYEVTPEGERISTYRVEEAYDSQGRKTLSIGFMGEEGKWKDIYSYDEENGETRISHEWENGEWFVKGRSYTRYAPNGQFALQWNEIRVNNNWVKGEKTEYIWKTAALIDYKIYSIGSGDAANEWVKQRKEAHAYSTDGRDKEIMITESIWKNDDWAVWEETKIEYAYNAKGDEIASVKTFKESGSSDWQNQYKTETAFSGDTITTIAYVGEGIYWVEESKNESVDADTWSMNAEYKWVDGLWEGWWKSQTYYFYENVDSLKEVEIRFDWDQDLQDWINYSKMELVGKLYGNDDLPKTYLMTNYSWENDEWLPTLLLEIDYLETMERSTYSEWINGQWVWAKRLDMGSVMNNLKHDKGYNWNGADWVLFGEDKYYYSDIMLDIKPLMSGASVTLYPNPVAEGFYVSGIQHKAQVTVVNMNGQTILKQAVNEGEMVSLAAAPQGIYLVRITNNGQDNVVKKIVKK